MKESTKTVFSVIFFVTVATVFLLGLVHLGETVVEKEKPTQIKPPAQSFEMWKLTHPEEYTALKLGGYIKE